MRFWLSRIGTTTAVMSVDNASVSGMNYSTLPANVRLVEWRDSGDGEIEYNDRPALREKTNDVLPYCTYFDQFLTKLTGLTLIQAKRVKVDLVKEVYETKRQAPYHYAVAAGDYSWDASDDALMSSTIPAIQNATSSLNAVITALNAAVAHINSNLVVIINENAGHGNTLVGQLNGAVVPNINTFVDAHNNSVNTENAYGVALIAHINTILGFFGVPETINGGIQRLPIAATDGFGAPGNSVELAQYATGWANPYTAGYVSVTSPGTFNNASVISYSALPPVTTTNVQWIPVGGTSPVTVTPTEAAAIMSGISTRSNDLAVKKNTKTGQINALTTIAAVIAYDVTTGW